MKDDWCVCVSVPRSLLLVSERAVISRLPVSDGPSMSLDVALPIFSLHNVRAVAYDINSDFVYWIDGRSKSIRRARNDGTQVCRLPVRSVSTLFFCQVPVVCGSYPDLTIDTVLHISVAIVYS